MPQPKRRTAPRSHTPSQVSTWAYWLDVPAGQPRWGVLESIAIAVWVAIVSFAVWQHVPWADEMQAWFLAGEVNTPTLLLHSLHYEGTGGLWHLFLKLCHSLHLHFFAARCLAAAVQCAAMVLLLRAPLPRAVRLLLPFTFFLLYQDAVVARSYCLLALLAFLAAAWLRERHLRPLSLALVLGLMANISVHGAILSGALAIVSAFVWRGAWLRRPAAMALLLCLWLAAMVAMAPAYDIDYEAGNNLRRSFARVEQQVGLHAVPPPPLHSLTVYGMPPLPPAVHVRGSQKAFVHRLQRLLAVITFPLSSSRILAMLVIALLVAQAWRPRSAQQGGALGLLGMLPWALMVLVFSSLFLAPRHAGTVFTALVVAAWLTWPVCSQFEAGAARRTLSRSAALVLAVACLQSIAWSMQTIVKEHRLPYSPGRMAAAYLHQQGAGPRSAANTAGFYYFSIDTLLPFTDNIFLNQPAHRYWLWSTSMGSRMTAQQVLAVHPHLVVVGGFEVGPQSEVTVDWRPDDAVQSGIVRGDAYRIVPFFTSHGYRVTRVFCGHSWMRASYAERICDTMLKAAPR